MTSGNAKSSAAIRTLWAVNESPAQMKKIESAIGSHLDLKVFENLDKLKKALLHKPYNSSAGSYLLLPIELASNLFLEATSASDTDLGLKMDNFSLRVQNESGHSVKLTFKEFQILSVLKEQHPRSVDRIVLWRSVWGDTQVGEKTIDVHLFQLRRKLEKIGFEIQFHASVYRLVRV